MKKMIFIQLIFVLFFMQKVFAYGVGYSTYPLKINKKLLSTEFTGILSNHGGVGFQGRYIQKYNESITFDGGMGVSGGQRRNSRLFAGVDYKIFSDYKRQPRISVKATFENTKNFKTRMNLVGITPTISKGVNFWGRPGYPYVAVPLGLALSNQNTYTTMMNLSLGIVGKIPMKWNFDLRANLEGTINIKGGYTGVLMGLSYYLN